LEVAAGKRICELLKLPPEYDAIVTCGAAAGMQSGLAGILTGNNPKFIEQIPDLTGMKSEVIIQKSHRNPFDHQLRNTGAKLVVVETREDVKKAINPQTAMMHFSNFANASGQIKVDEWVKLAHENNLPAFIDAAADTPPVSNLWNFAKMGYDLIAFSGGKAIRGPQCAGLLIGKKELVANALLNNSPHEDVIGRSQKVGKEEIVGMVKALEIYLNEDHAAIEKEWWRRLDAISSEVTRVPGVTTSYHVPDVANHVPHMNIFWDPRKISLSSRDAAKAMREGKPSVVIGGSENGLGMSSFMLKPGEEKIIAARLVELFKSHTA
jgi:L-seryl-tRNA(Ser) seleniumtransferase